MEKLVKLIGELGAIRKCPQFLYYYAIDPLGAIQVRKSITKFKKENSGAKEVDFILQSPGGSADDAYRIIRTLRTNFETVNIIIPFPATTYNRGQRR